MSDQMMYMMIERLMAEPLNKASKIKLRLMPNHCCSLPSQPFCLNFRENMGISLISR